MNVNLHHVRRLVGTDLVEQVDKITRDFNEETDELSGGPLLWVDHGTLRGFPYTGRVAGVITDSFVPGSDEHLDLLDALNYG